MKKLILRIFGVAISLSLVVFCIYQANSTKFAPLGDGTQGTTAGNLYNNGLVCQFKDQIYFSNLRDGGSLYVMDTNFKNFKQLSKDTVSNLNVAGNYIIYTKNTAFRMNPVGLYRCTLSGKQSTALDTSAQGMAHLYGNQIYFQQYKDKNSHYLQSISLDGETSTTIVKAPIAPASIQNNTLYYSGVKEDRSIHAMDLKTKESRLLLKGRYTNVVATKDSLYMMDLSDDYSIIRTDLNGNNKKTIVADRTCTFNLSEDGNYLYYQVDDNKNNGIHRLNLSTNKDELLLGGNYANFNMTKDYLFFTDFKQTQMYALQVGDGQDVHTFDPPVKHK